MAVVSRPPAAAAQSQHRKARAGRVLTYGEGGGDGGLDGLHHKEWNARAQGGSGRSGDAMSRSRRSSSVERGMVYRGDEFAGGGWCGGCMTRSGAVSPPPPPPRERGRKGGGERQGRSEGKVGGGDMGSVVKSFSGGLDRGGSTPGSSPAFRPRLSPGKVSPLVEVVPPAAHAPAVQQREQAVAPAVFSMANYVSMAGKMNSGAGGAGVSSSPPVEKIKASPTLFEMMSHEQELQGVKAVHTLSLSQQLTFQEKMKSILTGRTKSFGCSWPWSCQCSPLPPILQP